MEAELNYHYLKELFTKELGAVKEGLEHKVICLQELADERLKTQKELLDSRSADRKTLMDAAMLGMKAELETKIQSVLDIFGERLNGQDEAKKIAVDDVNRRLLAMNEFRDQIREERISFLDKEAYERDSKEQQRRVSALELAEAATVTRPMYDKLEQDLDARMKLLENAKANAEGRMWRIGSTISILTMLGYLAIAYFGHTR